MDRGENDDLEDALLEKDEKYGSLLRRIKEEYEQVLMIHHDSTRGV